MADELRKTGISVVGDVPWGTHLCHFYETKEDLLDILIPYFKAGLENEEFCIWVVSDPLGEGEVRDALRQAVPEADRYLAASHIEIVPYTRFPPSRQLASPPEHIEIIPHTDWYLKDGAFIAERVLNGWNQKLADALAKGYAGLRANGNEAWLTEENREAFSAYEKTLDESLAGQRMIVLCSYPLAGSSAAQIFDVVNTHQLGILRRRGKWERIETPEPIQAKAEIKRLNKELGRALDKRSEPPAILTYGIAVLSVIAAVIILLLMDTSLQAAAHVSLFLCAVIFSTWFGGIRPGLLAIVLSVLAFAYILPPPESFAVEIPHLPRLLLFALLAFFVGSLTAAQRNKAASLRRARDVLNGTVQQLKQTNEALRREIIERKRAEGRLRLSEDRIRLIIDTIPVMAWSVRPDGIVDFLNQRWLDYSGLSFEQYIENPTGPIHHEDIPRVMEKWRTSISAGEPYEAEMRLRRADGEYRWFMVRTEPLRDEQGAIVSWYGVSTDIEDLKRAEAALKESQRRLEEAQRITHVGHWDRDLETGRITWSDEIYRILGLSLQERDSTRTEWLDIVHPEDRQRLSLAIEEMQRGIRRFDVEFRIVRPNGEVRFLHSLGDVIRDERGRPLRRFGTAQDITERKQAEEKLRATSEQLRSLSASLQSAKEEEGARIAREIHDELGSRLTSLKWDLEGINKILSDSGEQLPELRKKLETMIELTDETIDTIGRISSELRPSILDDLGLVAAIEWQAKEFQTRTRIVCTCDCSMENVGLNRKQSTAVFRIFQEALTNVLRHAQATKIDIRTKQEDGQFVLTVSDNGRGITEAEKSDVLSLGLLGMKERARLVGGEIDIARSEEGGTAITVRVPVARNGGC